MLRKHPPHRIPLTRLVLMARRLRFKALLLTLAVCTGCSLGEIRKQSQLIGNLGMIRGKVSKASDQVGPINVSLYGEDKGTYLLKGKAQLNSLGEYQFYAVPGTYYIAAFIDGNSDGAYQPGEHWNYHGKPTGIPVAAGQTVTVEAMTVSGEPPALHAGAKTENHLSPVLANIGRVVRLDDPLFDRENYHLGMWRPVDFIAQVGGGLLLLQDYERDKIPVLLIHGINGGPSDLKSIIEHLDRKRFQPWVFYYPSGVRLNMASEYLVKAVAELQSRFGFSKLIVLGHSMGGLVTRSFVKKYAEQYPDRLDGLLLVMTVNSPMGGVPGAAIGLRAPFMVQSWLDVAPESAFLHEIHSWPWPKHIPYYLIFSHESGKDDDGVVSLGSQIPWKLQQEAAHMYGFTNSHVGTLNDDSFLGLLDGILATAR